MGCNSSKATAVVVPISSSTTNEAPKNSAFVFIKPHANTTFVQTLLQKIFKENSISIVKEGELTGEKIDAGKLIDQHYYAIGKSIFISCIYIYILSSELVLIINLLNTFINFFSASKATLVKPADLPVPADKFEAEFGLKWDDALAQGVVYNAADACQFLGYDADQLNEVWQPCKKVKFGGGFYCGKLEIPDKAPIYVFNAFFMTMRAKFVTAGSSIHYYQVVFDPSALTWADFRGKILGPTDPKDAPPTSVRGQIFTNWKELGLSYEPFVSDNGVHASASPFEGLAERMNWMKDTPETDMFGAQLIAAGISADTIRAWSLDPQVKGKSLFDQLEDLDASACLAKAVELNKE